MPIDEKPSRNEDEYFAKREAELIRARRSKLDEERTKAERSAHYMRCPKCGGTLGEREFHHVKVDICSDCKGMWLDPGELELLKLVDGNRVSRFIDSLFGLKR